MLNRTQRCLRRELLLKRVTAALVACLLAWAAAQTPEADAIVLRLGERTVLLSEFDERFDFYIGNLAARQNMPLTDETRPVFEQLRPAYLEQLATEQLVLELGRGRGLNVGEGYVDEQVERIRSSFDSPEAFQAGLEGAGIGSEAQLRVYLEEAELSRQTVAALQERVEVPDYLVQLAYDANREAFTQPEQTCARHILVETLEEAQVLSADLAGGASFEELASASSLDPGSAAQGGDVGCFPPGAMVGEFEDAAFGTPLDTVSAPVQSPYGYHLVLPYARQEAATAPLAEVEGQLRDELARQIIRKVIEGYRANADLELFPDTLGTPGPAEEETEGD